MADELVINVGRREYAVTTKNVATVFAVIQLTHEEVRRVAAESGLNDTARA